MPVDLTRYSFGTPPTRTATRGPLAGQQVPRFEVILPGWSDIIHLSSDLALTPEERSIERQRRAASLSKSPTPEIARDFAAIGQAADDIQDGLVTLSVAGRLLTKLSGKVIPGVGLISTAADVINVFNVLYPSAAVKAVVGAGDRLGSKLSGRKKYLASKSVKRALGLDASKSLATYARRLEQTVKTGKLGFGLGEALQIAQTSDSLFGIGVSLGPIFGAMQDTFFGMLRGARFDVGGVLGLTGQGVLPGELAHMQQFAPGDFDLYQRRAVDIALQRGLPAPSDPVGISDLLRRNPVRVQVDWPGIIPAYEYFTGLAPGAFDIEALRVAKPLLDTFGAGAKVTLQAIGAAKRITVDAAVKVWEAGKWLVGVRGDLSWEDHLVLVVAQALAVKELSPLMQQFDWSAESSFRPGFAQAALPFCGRDCRHVRSAAAVAGCLAAGPALKPLDWLDEIPSADAREFAEQTLIQAGGDLLEALEGPAPKIIEDSGVGFRSVRMLHEYNLLPPYDRSEEELSQFVGELLSMVEGSSDHLPPISAVSDLYVRCFPGVES